MLNTRNWQTLQERRLRTRLIMFHKVINENVAIPTHNILHQRQPMTRSSRKDSYRQIQCNKFSSFCQTIKDWNKLSPDIPKTPLQNPSRVHSLTMCSLILIHTLNKQKSCFYLNKCKNKNKKMKK
jgi:hypothetical protein